MRAHHPCSGPFPFKPTLIQMKKPLILVLALAGVSLLFLGFRDRNPSSAPQSAAPLPSRAARPEIAKSQTPAPPPGSLGEGRSIPESEMKRREAFSDSMNLLTQSLSGEIGSDEDRRELLRLLAESPERAMEWVEGLDPAARRIAMRLVLATEWASIDYAAAWAWAGSQSEDALSVAVLCAGALDGSEMIDQAKGWLAVGGDRADMRAGALVGILTDSSQWTLLDPVIKLCPDHQQERLLNSSIYSLAAQDPGLALEMVGRIGDEQVRSEQLRSVMDGWSREQLPALAEYALKQSDPVARAGALDFFAYNLITSGRRDELVSWLDLHPEHRGIENQGMALLAHQVPGTEHAFEFALRGISKIPEDDTRTRLYSEVMIKLASLNPGEAARMVRESGVIDGTSKEALLKSLLPKQ